MKTLREIVQNREVYKIFNEAHNTLARRLEYCLMYKDNAFFVDDEIEIYCNINVNPIASLEAFEMLKEDVRLATNGSQIKISLGSYTSMDRLYENEAENEAEYEVFHIRTTIKVR